MKIVAAPHEFGFDDGSTTGLEIILYGHADRSDRSGVGAHIPDVIRRLKLRPANRAWDFLSLALAVQATDASVTRSDSPDGWTRQLDLTVSVIDPDFWNQQSGLINGLFQFLTTDIWNIRFQIGGIQPAPPAKPSYPTQDCVSLLSGDLTVSWAQSIYLVAKKRFHIWSVRCQTATRLTRNILPQLSDSIIYNLIMLRPRRCKPNARSGRDQSCFLLTPFYSRLPFSGTSRGNLFLSLYVKTASFRSTPRSHRCAWAALVHAQRIQHTFMESKSFLTMRKLRSKSPIHISSKPKVRC